LGRSLLYFPLTTLTEVVSTLFFYAKLTADTQVSDHFNIPTRLYIQQNLHDKNDDENDDNVDDDDNDSI